MTDTNVHVLWLKDKQTSMDWKGYRDRTPIQVIQL